MIDQDITFLLWTLLIALAFGVVSFLIPYYGFIHKRYKGLFLGCLVQPVVIAVIIFLAVGVFLYHSGSEVKSQRKAAMVTFWKAENDSTDTRAYYYVKNDDECFCEKGVGKEDKTIFGYDNDNETSVYDVFYVDSTTICVDDEFFVKFDFKNRKVTATDYDDPIEVTNVDWEKVEAYFKEKNSK